MGNIGPPGNVGPQGAVGPQGNTGTQGPQGSVGNIGPPGNVGPQGAVGPQGNTGTQGPQGSVGNIGPPGNVGPQGAAGAQGNTGSTGPQGPQGPSQLLVNKTLYVDQINGTVFGVRGDMTKPFDTLSGALAAALSGDTIQVRPGSFNQAATLSTNNISWFFEENTTVTNTGTVSLFSGANITVLGYCNFILSSTGGIINSATTTVFFECSNITNNSSTITFTFSTGENTINVRENFIDTSASISTFRITGGTNYINSRVIDITTTPFLDIRTGAASLTFLNFTEAFVRAPLSLTRFLLSSTITSEVFVTIKGGTVNFITSPGITANFLVVFLNSIPTLDIDILSVVSVSSSLTANNIFYLTNGGDKTIMNLGSCDIRPIEVSGNSPANITLNAQRLTYFYPTASTFYIIVSTFLGTLNLNVNTISVDAHSIITVNSGSFYARIGQAVGEILLQSTVAYNMQIGSLSNTGVNPPLTISGTATGDLSIGALSSATTAFSYASTGTFNGSIQNISCTSTSTLNVVDVTAGTFNLNFNNIVKPTGSGRGIFINTANAYLNGLFINMAGGASGSIGISFAHVASKVINFNINRIYSTQYGIYLSGSQNNLNMEGRFGSIECQGTGINQGISNFTTGDDGTAKINFKGDKIICSGGSLSSRILLDHSRSNLTLNLSEASTNGTIGISLGNGAGTAVSFKNFSGRYYCTTAGAGTSAVIYIFSGSSVQIRLYGASLIDNFTPPYRSIISAPGTTPLNSQGGYSNAITSGVITTGTYTINTGFK